MLLAPLAHGLIYLRGGACFGSFGGFVAKPVGVSGAEIAFAAAFPFGFLAKVLADDTGTALPAGGVSFDFAVALPGAADFAFVAELLDEMNEDGEVAAAPEKDAICVETVAARAAGLLVVLFDALGQGEVDDGAGGGFVDAQAEGESADHDGSFVAHPEFLIFLAAGRVQFAVVGDGADTLGLEGQSSLFDALDGAVVNDYALAFVLAEDREQEAELIAAAGIDGDIAEIGAVEADDEFAGVAELELGEDVLADAWGSAGGEGGDGGVGEVVADLAEEAVFGAKLMAPLADAMGFVDGEPADVHLLEHLDGVFLGHAFGGEVEETEFSAQGATPDVFLGFPVDVAVQASGGNAFGGQLGGLVLHQGDEGRDDDAGLAGDDGRQLIAEAFAAAGGHDGGHVAAIEQATDDSFLLGAETGMAPITLKLSGEVIHPYQCSGRTIIEA